VQANWVHCPPEGEGDIAQLFSIREQYQRFDRTTRAFRRQLDSNHRALDARTGISGLSDSGNQRIWLTLEFAQTRVGNTEAASRAFGKAIEIDPRSQVGREASRLLAALPR